MLLTPAGPGIRLDSGVYAGWTVPIDYDPLLAKLIGYGQDRQQAISRLTRALPEYFVAGIKTNLGLFRRILADGDFQSGKIDTGYLDRLLAAKAGSADGAAEKSIAAIAAAVFSLLDSTSNPGSVETRGWAPPPAVKLEKNGPHRRADVARSRWRTGVFARRCGTWRETGGTPVLHLIRISYMIYDVTIDGTVFRLDLNLDRASGRWRCLVDGREVEMDAVLAQPDVLSILIEGKAWQIRRERLASGLQIWVGDQSYAAEVCDPRSLRNRKARGDAGKGPRHLVAPMPGKGGPVPGWREFAGGSRAGRGGGRSHEDAERNQVAEKRDCAEVVGERRRSGECRRCAGDCGVEMPPDPPRTT